MLNQSSQSQDNQGKGRKTSIVIALLLLLAVITIGYASLSASLNISGTSKIKDNTWNVGPDERDPDVIVCPTGETCTINPQNEDPARDPRDLEPDDGEDICTDPADQTTCTPGNGAVIWMDGNTVYFKHVLTEPGDVFTFTAKYTNNGSVDAKIASVSTSELNATAQQFLTYTATYEDGTAVQVGDELPAGQSKTFKITVAYKSTVTTLPTEAQLAAINEDGNGAKSLFTVQYEQK